MVEIVFLIPLVTGALAFFATVITLEFLR